MVNIKGTLPNILTLINLCFGVIAILFAVRPNNDINLLILASLLIITAALMDRFDGKVARMLDAASELGRELDSLADFISFGVAPVIISWKISLFNFGIIGYAVCLIFSMAGAYRLARYNVTAFDSYFRGIPITMAGAFLTICNIYNCFAIVNNKLTQIHSLFTTLIILLLSFLMVSNMKIKKM